MFSYENSVKRMMMFKLKFNKTAVFIRLTELTNKELHLVEAGLILWYTDDHSLSLSHSTDSHLTLQTTKFANR